MRYRSVLLASLATLTASATRNESATAETRIRWNVLGSDVARQQLFSNASIYRPPKHDDCDCFNCKLPKFTCGQYGECSEFDGQCKCPAGWAGQDCLLPQCGSLADGKERLPRPEGELCDCASGWDGLNCNVCRTKEACAYFPFGNYTQEQVENANMTCYKGGETILQNHQMCNVTNQKILDTLNGPLPQVTFGCDISSDTCLFQFWIGNKESFYCGLDTCTITALDGDVRKLQYSCEKLKCQCIQDRMMCGESGSVDIGEFLKEEIKGPAKFTCREGGGCTFEERAMNELITTIFGDPYITLDCFGGECIPGSMVPGYVRPPKPNNTPLVAASAGVAAAIFLIVFAGLWYVGRAKSDNYNAVWLPETEIAKLMAEHVPASLQFQNISYKLGDRSILENITGCVDSGELLAIMGASGAGKSTFLDILARKNKRGSVSGDVLVNGRAIGDNDFRNAVGFVDQEDTLMGTLTVYETVLYSALLRLPRDMSYSAKKYRTLETLHELGLLGVKDARIGTASRRSISGGEKRRVSIACELVTSPSILFLDEPTSGLDAYNALNVVESLVSLAKDYKRTVVFTIHQPRSNIVALFHHLIVLAEGKMVYSGAASQCTDHFKQIGRPCPPGFNIADYLIDVTMTPENSESTGSLSLTPNRPDGERVDEEQGFLSPQNLTSDDSLGEIHPRKGSSSSETGSVKQKISQLLKFGGASQPAHNVSSNVESLAGSYATSLIAEEVKREITARQQEAASNSQNLASDAMVVRGHRRASWATQFTILSGRAFKNMYRDPALLAANYTASIVVALICGLFFRNVGLDIKSFQNRLGFFFFTLALFGFSCLSSLGLFANERILFMRERSNGYYSTLTYFASKVLFDIIPLRVVPPLVYGSIAYGLVGLVSDVATFWKFMLTLVLFNLTTASVVFAISVGFASTNVGTLAGTLIMLFNLLFAGLLINGDSLPLGVRWLPKISFFHAAFEALAVNELRTLQLVESKYGVDINVPSATILNLFGLKALAFWWPDIITLGIFFGSFTLLSFLLLQFWVKEQR